MESGEGGVGGVRDTGCVETGVAAPYAGAIPARALPDPRPGVFTPRSGSTGRAPGYTGMLRDGHR